MRARLEAELRRVLEAVERCDAEVRETRPGARGWRGRYWRPDGCGYTDDIEDAGRWPAGSQSSSDRSVVVPEWLALARDVLREQVEALDRAHGEIVGGGK